MGKVKEHKAKVKGELAGQAPPYKRQAHSTGSTSSPQTSSGQVHPFFIYFIKIFDNMNNSAIKSVVSGYEYFLAFDCSGIFYC